MFKIKLIAAGLLSAILIIGISYGTAEIMPGKSKTSGSFSVDQNAGTPNVIPHERKARTDCIRCHSDDIEQSYVHPEGLIDECRQCHVYHWQYD